MERYEKYKDSGVEYIGEIPVDWNVVKIKFLSSGVKTGSTPPSEEIEYFEPGEINWYGPGDFLNILLEDAKRKISKKAIEDGKCRLFGPESILLIGIGATVGKFGKAKTHFSANQQINVISFINEKYLPDFGLYFLSTIKEIIYTTASFATLPIFNQSQTKELILPVPSTFSEQIYIVDYLDKKTSELDTLITKKEKLIELLKEERTALINQAVTKGLDLGVEMKDSGVEWLGEIPGHWEVSKIKYLGDIVSGYSFKSDDFKDENTGCRVMKISNIQTMNIDWSDESFVPLNFYEEYSRFQITNGDLVFALTRPIISTGIKASIVNSDEKILLNQRNAVLKPKELLNVNWMYYIIFQSRFIDYFSSLIDSTGQQPNISTGDIANIPIPLPSIKEQNAILTYIDIEKEKFSNILLKTNQEITLLKEYKTALISEVVTGKVKVI